jgi:hypothetical protein
MSKLTIAFLILLASCGAGFAQKPDFQCVVIALNLDSANVEVIERRPVIEIGRFDIAETMEEERITRFFRFPKTKWFVVASLYTTDESMLSKSGIGSIDLELSFARKRRRNLFKSPAVATAETPFQTFDIVRVTTIVRLDNHRYAVTLECKAP